MDILKIGSNQRVGLAELKRRIRRIEGHTAQDNGLANKPDTTVIDPPLIGQCGVTPALHELVANGYLDQPAVRDFTLALLAGLMRREVDQGAMVLWCQRTWDIAEFGRLYGPGLKALGLPPERFLMVTGKRDADCLWAMEQGLASRSLLAVVGQVDQASLIASRRLSLAASVHSTFCFLLPVHHGRDPSAARTRWRVGSAPSSPDHLDLKGLGNPTWQLDLERSPNGQIGHWIVEWDYAAHHFHLAPQLGNQPAARHDSPNKKSSDVVAFGRTG